MKFEKIKSLSNSEILDGIELCFLNSNELYKSSIILKENGTYGVSISLMILSTEELMKAQSLLNLLFLENEKREIYKDIFESNDLHKSRNKFALFSNEYFKLLDKTRILEIEKEFNGNDKYLAEYLSERKIIDKTIKNTDDEIKTSKNWFAHANKLKNDGLYVEFNEKWFSPSRFIEKDWLKSQNEIELLRNTISESLEFIISRKENIENILIELKKFQQKIY